MVQQNILKLPLQEQLNKAIQLAHQNKTSEAIIIFENIISTELQDFRVFKTIGSLYKSEKNNKKAILNLQKSLVINNKQIDVHFTLGQINQAERDHHTAITYFNNILALEKNNISALYNKAHSLILIKQYANALACYQSITQMHPKDIDALIGQANAHKKLHQFKQAEINLLTAQSIEPKNCRVLFNLAVNLVDQYKFSEAIHLYLAVLKNNPNIIEAYENIGLCYIKTQQTNEALLQFERGLKIQPKNQRLNHFYSSLKFELNEKDFLDHYHLLTKNKAPAPIHEDYIKLLMNNQQFDEAQQELKLFEKFYGTTNKIKQLHFDLLFHQKEYQEIITTIKNNDDTSNFTLTLARSYLAQGEYKQALNVLYKLTLLHPHDQNLWSLYSIALKKVNPDEYAHLCDYDKLILTAQLDYPKRYGSLTTFNEALLEALEQTHCMEVSPLEQSLVGGTQTPGFIFEQANPIFNELKDSLTSTINSLLSKVSPEQQINYKSHPTWSRWSTDFEFAAAWSVWLNSCGYHKSHIHSKGWYSSAYYVSVPSTVNNNSNDGYLKFGESPSEYNQALSIEQFIKPEAGCLALFPSFFWHGTQAFKSNEPRVSIAFDLTPKNSF